MPRAWLLDAFFFFFLYFELKCIVRDCHGPLSDFAKKKKKKDAFARVLG